MFSIHSTFFCVPYKFFLTIMKALLHVAPREPMLAVQPSQRLEILHPPILLHVGVEAQRNLGRGRLALLVKPSGEKEELMMLDLEFAAMFENSALPHQ